MHLSGDPFEVLKILRLEPIRTFPHNLQEPQENQNPPTPIKISMYAY